MKTRLFNHTRLKFGLQILTASLAFTTLAHAAGARGGGDIIDVIVDGQSKKELYDLVSKYTCNWRSGHDMIESHPEYKAILEKVANLDWYFANDLRRETESLSFCVNQSLLPIFKWLKTTPEKTVRAAFRHGQNVYWDESEAAALSPRSAAMLMIHETMHSYLSMGLSQPERYLKLWSLVNTISNVENGTITKRGDLHFQMEKNSVDFSLAVDDLDHFRTQIEFVLGSPEKRSAMILQSASPEDLITLTTSQGAEIARALTDYDAQYLRSLNLKNLLTKSLQALLVKADLTTFRLILEKPYNELNPALIALSVERYLSTDAQNFIYASQAFQNAIRDAYESLTRLQISESKSETKRILAEKNFGGVIDNTEDEIGEALFLIRARPLTAQKGLPAELKGWLQIVVNAIDSGEWARVESLVTANPKFYLAFGLKNQFAQLAVTEPSVAREKPRALSVLREVRQGLIRTLMSRVRAQLKDPDQVEELRRRIDWSNLNNETP